MFKSFWSSMSSQQKNLEDGITPALIKSIIEEVENDPYAGLGALSRKAMLIDKLYAAWRMHSCMARGVPLSSPRAIISEPPAAPEALPSNIRITRPTDATPTRPTEVKPTEVKKPAAQAALV